MASSQDEVTAAKVSPPRASHHRRCPRLLVHSAIGFGLVVVSLVLVFVFNSAFSLSASPLLRGRSTPVIVVLGDSITEYGENPQLMGYVSMLANAYVRRADVVNRGSAGWTTRTWLPLFPAMVQDWERKPPALVSIFLGANDAAVDTDAQHVPIDEFASNLREMVRLIQQAFPACHVMLVTPPTVDDATCIYPRRNALTEVYAKSCVEVGAALNVSVVDLWTAFQNRQNTTKRLHVANDGLHLNDIGNELVYDLWLAQVNQDMPLLSPRQLPIVFS
ncbi:hypothetical protein AaE_013014 [Aphanomyces astaci]|uniref:SGNH hydrolase-type esterase domain-containing protein n=1 Tax=Aphanomyces astaci TaxID=112090 RepID=A0A6A4ZCD8_APHAT|nr:hypothetical protein AaE_013014 [Aphanomyces astaci]